jgi:hypothetical protein
MSAIRHHFLPRVYLKRFASPKQRRLLWEFDKANDSFQESTPKKSGYCDNFYTFTNAQGQRDNETLEKKFHDIENRIPKFYEALRKEENPLSNETAFAFVLFAASMFIRVPKYLERVDFIETQKMRTAFEQARKEEDFIARAESVGVPRAVLDYARVEADPSYTLQKAIRGLEVAAIPFAQMAWQFLKAPAGMYFITGGHPVVHCNPNIQHALFEIGLEDSAIEVTFPLSRTMCAFGRWNEMQDRYRLVDAETVQAINYRTWLAAGRYVYSPINGCQLWR